VESVDEQLNLSLVEEAKPQETPRLSFLSQKKDEFQEEQLSAKFQSEPDELLSDLDPSESIGLHLLKRPSSSYQQSNLPPRLSRLSQLTQRELRTQLSLNELDQSNQSIEDIEEEHSFSYRRPTEIDVDEFIILYHDEILFTPKLPGL
jgi:hypothetical protein